MTCVAPLSLTSFSRRSWSRGQFQASGAKLAVLCSSDRRYGEQAAEMAKALKGAGCSWLALAGAPGDAQEAYEAAGIDDFIAMGGDLLASLNEAWATLGA